MLSVLEGFYWLLACLLVIYELAEQVRELGILGKHLRGDLVLVRVAAAWPRPAALQQLHHLKPARRAERVESRPGRGRCLVTTRDCEPVLTAPHTRSRPQCLACARLAPPARCPRCGIVM